MKLKTSTKIMIAVCIAGLLLLMYPVISNYWNAKHATKAISTYVNDLENVKREDYSQLWQDAIAYNQELLSREDPFRLSPEMRFQYSQLLNISGSGVMGYVEIPKLNVSLPIYHGTDEAVLQIAVGHIDWSSLPTGGESTHCVISGHRGLPSAKLFTDLDKLRETDTFTMYILNEALTYEVDQIRIVEPSDLQNLTIETGKDYCTLVTCTPYGINSHRMLVRGHRIENAAVQAHVVSEAIVIDPLIVAPIVAFPFLFLLLMMVMLKKPEKKPKLENLHFD